MNQNAIANWCMTGVFPDTDTFYETLLKGDGQFEDAEGPWWDFKETWPFSLSDDYFAGIARLIAAFSNSQGGLIVFGVHDQKRTGGHNKVRPNLDRFTAALEQLFSVKPSIEFKSYFNEKAGDVDLLLVKRRQDGIAPLRFRKPLGKYRAGAIWVRVGHEVKTAEPAQYPILFCRLRSTDFSENRPLDGSIPPSPATLKQRFVGRTEVLDRLFHWLETSDEPRMYLYGKGGSGKTTIAYEFARLLREYGDNLRMFGGENLDTVIFISAKEKALAVADGKIIDTEQTDFTNEKEMLRSILYYGGWSRDSSYLATAPIEQLRTEIKEFFDFNSILVVIDDIDTLTTKGVESGSDFLYRILCRASRHSKIVYTLRNVPSLSLLNAIEVPGLDDDDYENFVDECVAHFHVPPPSKVFRVKRLSEISERRPLVIESIIALRRTTGDYDQAVELFHQQTGDAIRDYVFLREWDALPSSAPRLLLAALSAFVEPASFQDLQSVLRFEASAVSDAIGAVREMFLKIDDAGNETLYTLAPLTRAFIKGRRSQLVGYTALHERVKAFQRHVAISNPRVANIATQVERLLPARVLNHRAERVSDAYRIVTNKALPPHVTEDPFFRTVLGYVQCCRPESRLGEIRDSFKFAIDMKFEPDFSYLRTWFNVERNSGVNDGWCLRIADLVLDGKRYQEREKMEMVSRKATSLYARAQERLYTDSTDALKDLKEALRLHLRAYRLNCGAADTRAELSEEYARNTAFQLTNNLSKSSVPWEFLEVIELMAKAADGYLDPLESPILEGTVNILKVPLRAEAIARTKNCSKSVAAAINSEKLWLSNSSRERVLKNLKAFEGALDNKAQILKLGTTGRIG